MFNPSAALIHTCVERLQLGYYCTYGHQNLEYARLIGQIGWLTLQAIAQSDALYHTVEHTVLVTLVGQEILRGKHLQEGTVSSQDWAQFIISLLCHDVGYVKGACLQDDVAQRLFMTGRGDRVSIAPGTTDASLTPYHVDRSQLFVAERLAHQSLLDVAAIQQTIELTRFPVPNQIHYTEIASYAGLARAADLIGQLSDPRYLEKIPALYYEFEEVGMNRALNYSHPDDLRNGFPAFFQGVVAPYIQQAKLYLEATEEGRAILQSLQANVATVEREAERAKNEARCCIPSLFQMLIEGWRYNHCIEFWTSRDSWSDSIVPPFFV